jgi:hypothetical protein
MRFNIQHAILIFTATAVDVGTQCGEKKSRKMYVTPWILGAWLMLWQSCIMSLNALLDASTISLLLASITFNLTAWNIVARNGKPGLRAPTSTFSSP